MALDERYVGHFNDDGSVKSWPAVTLAGAEYVRPITMVRTSKLRFVVVHSSDEMKLMKQRETEGEGVPAPAADLMAEVRAVADAKPAPARKSD